MVSYQQILDNLNGDKADGLSDEQVVMITLQSVNQKIEDEGGRLPASLSGIVRKVERRGYTEGDLPNLKSTLETLAREEAGAGGRRRRGKKTRKPKKSTKRRRCTRRR